MKNHVISVSQALLLSALLPALSVKAQSQTSTQSSDGTSQKLTVSLTSTHGVSTSAQMSPDFDVTTSAKMIIRPDSFSTQAAADGASAAFTPGLGGGSQGISGVNQVNFGAGTEYSVNIKPRELGPGEAPSILGTASGSAVGTTNTSLTIESTQSSFVNTLTQQFR
jgi:hypothetical protein